MGQMNTHPYALLRALFVHRRSARVSPEWSVEANECQSKASNALHGQFHRPLAVGIIETERLSGQAFWRRPWRAARLGVVGARVAVAVMSATLPPKKPEYVGLATPFFVTLLPRPHAMFHSSRTCVVYIANYGEDAVEGRHICTSAVELRVSGAEGGTPWWL